MMVTSDKPTVHDERPGGAAIALGKIALGLALATATLFSTGVAVGAGAALLEDGSNPLKAGAIIGVALVCAAACIWGLVRLRPRARPGEPVSPRIRKANNLLLLSGALGGVLGAALALSLIGSGDPAALFSTSPMPPAVIIPALAIWLLVVPLVSWQWHRSVDEHEADAYRFGGLAGLYLYAFLAPAWWFAWRGGLVPAPDTMAIYLLVIGVWGIGWFWRRYR